MKLRIERVDKSYERYLGKFRWVNAQMLDMLGCTEQEMIGKGIRMIYPACEESERVGQVKYAQIRECGNTRLSEY